MVKNNNLSYVVLGLFLGDEGKGSITDYLVRKNNAKLVSRFNGGSQAGHSAAEMRGDYIVEFSFHQFGAGSLVPDVKTFLPNNLFIDPETVFREANGLKQIGVRVLNRLKIAESAKVIFPFNVMLNRMSEAENNYSRGTVGRGVGDAVLDSESGKSIFISDLLDPSIFERKLDALLPIKSKQFDELLENELAKHVAKFFPQALNKEYLIKRYTQFGKLLEKNIVDSQYLADYMSAGKNVVFEGAQGALLDKTFGFDPYITKTTVVLDSLKKVIDLDSFNRVHKIGVIRGYATRHGHGPFVTELLENELIDRLADKSTYSQWQGNFRVGWLDMLGIKYALSLSKKIDSLAVTNLDRLEDISPKVCLSYAYVGQQDKLDNYFEWNKLSADCAEITGFKFPLTAGVDMAERTEILLNCKPRVLKSFDSWGNICQVTVKEDLPQETVNYLNFISESLNVPVEIVSVGPTAENKLTC